MTGSPELLEFYLVEATEYLDALDQLVAASGTPPDANAFIATARALRGTSSMAKVEPVAAIASAIESVAHALREGELRWTGDLFSVLRSTVDDLRFLVRGVRTWGERESARADARLADIGRFLPTEPARPAAPAAASTAPVFIALQSSAIAAELDAFVLNPRHRRALDDALTRARTMRGVAGIGDFPPLADVADAVERTARSLMPDAPLSDAEVELFRSAAEVLRRTSNRLRDNLPSEANPAEVARFARAVGALQQAPAPGDQPVVAIDQLFYADAGPHIVQRGTSPTTREQRLRGELTARAEHLRRLVHDARQSHDLAGRERAARQLRAALADVAQVAHSFGAAEISRFASDRSQDTEVLSPSSLDTIDAGAVVLLAPGGGQEEVTRRLRALLTRHTPAVPAPAVAPPAPPATAPEEVKRPPAREVSKVAQAPVVSTPRPAPESTMTIEPAVPSRREPPSIALRDGGSGGAPGTVRRPPPTPTGRELQDLLQEGLAGLRSLDNEPLSLPARLEEDDIVPIDSLLYRGASAVRRAIEVRDAMQARGTSDEDTLQEIFDLLDLAQAE